MKTTDKLFECTFSKKLMKITRQIVNKWSSIHAENLQDSSKNKDYKNFESVGTDEELNYYKYAEKFWAIQSTLEDLDKVFVFIEIDRNNITKFYPKIETQENYFKYHLENYIIRVYTVIDLVGKLGNLIYKTNIPDEDCNCYKFKEKIKKERPEIADLLEDILQYADEKKRKRHKKLHTGKLEIDELKGFSFWEDFGDVLPENFDYKNPILKLMNEEHFKNMVDELRKYIVELINKINKFLDKSLEQI